MNNKCFIIINFSFWILSTYGAETNSSIMVNNLHGDTPNCFDDLEFVDLAKYFEENAEPVKCRIIQTSTHQEMTPASHCLVKVKLPPPVTLWKFNRSCKKGNYCFTMQPLSTKEKGNVLCYRKGRIRLVDNNLKSSYCNFKFIKASHGYVFQNVITKRFLVVPRYSKYIYSTFSIKQATAWSVCMKQQ